jgi:tyrosine-protein kinase Etk/Wzc
MAQYELNLLDYWLIIKKRKYTILLTAGLVILFTIALTQLLKPILIYEASARVQFDRSVSLAGMLLEAVGGAASNELATQVEVIRSFPVIEPAAVELQLVQADAAPEVRRSEPYLNAIYGFQQGVKTSQEGATNIIKITATNEHPVMVARMANAVAEAYRRENIRTRNRLVVESRQFVEEQLASLEVKLKEAEENLREFKEQKQQVFLSDEAKNALDTFTRLEAEYDRVRRLEQEAAKQLQRVKQGDLASDHPEARIFTEDPNSLLSDLNGKLVELIQERATLLINYTPEHPKAKELHRKIVNLRAEMVRELENKIENLNEQKAALSAQIGQHRTKYLSFPEAAIELSRLEREVKVDSDLFTTLRNKHQELLVKSSERIEEVTILEPAAVPLVAVNKPKNDVNMLVGTLMGLFLGIVLAFLRESFDTSIGTIEGVEEFLKVPVLGVIPTFDAKVQKQVAAKELPPDVTPETLDMFSKLVVLSDPKSILAEGFRSLRTNIQFASMDRDIKTILFTSAGLGEGKTLTVVNLAITLVQDGKKVLLVDADLRRPALHRRLGIDREPGLTDVLMKGMPWREGVRNVTDLMIGALGVDRVLGTPGLDNLSVITGGVAPSNPAEFLNSSLMVELIGELRREYDVVLFDTPPILPIADTLMLASRVDGVIIIYQVGRIGRGALRRAKFLLDHAQSKMLGVVLTNVRAETSPDYQDYRYDYR